MKITVASKVKTLRVTELLRVVLMDVVGSHFSHVGPFWLSAACEYRVYITIP